MSENPMSEVVIGGKGEDVMVSLTSQTAAIVLRQPTRVFGPLVPNADVQSLPCLRSLVSQESMCLRPRLGLLRGQHTSRRQPSSSLA